MTYINHMRECLIIIFLILLIWNIRLYIEFPETLVVSAIDGEEYTVKKNFENTQSASNILARLNYINKTLIEHLRKKYADTHFNSEVEYLAENYNGDVLQEHIPRTTINTSYVLNKGDLIKLCLRSPKTGEFHDFNTLVFVNLHELSHLLDREYGHNISFWTSFKFILTTAAELGLYVPIDYSKNPTQYCGIIIKNSPYYRTYK